MTEASPHLQVDSVSTESSPDLVIITGLSGAGKSTTMRVFEDLDYYCLDNLPPALIRELHGLYRKSITGTRGIAIASDVRSGALFDDLKSVLTALREEGVLFSLVYLDCATEVLMNRYKEVRRSHPLETQFSLKDAITAERSRLEPVLELATCVIDTSRIDVRTLRQVILNRVIGMPESSVPLLRFTSFGFKYGPPPDVDFLFDVRFLPNPFYLVDLRHLCGEDDPVFAYVFSAPRARVFADGIVSLLNPIIDAFVEVGKFSVNVAIGCTGGHHRSVAFVRYLSEYYTRDGRNVVRAHRDIGCTV